ncbi:MAG TPA: DUF4007 family protein [Candidatus Rifleibacterium sp.]|nr:DUF4007 family protein [Candidatus Rifleibacterium sp.]
MKEQERLKTNFHETFSLNRSRLATVLKLAAKSGRKLSFEFIRENTELGTNYCKSVPAYAKGCGFLSFDNTITEFGRKVYEEDPNLIRPTTLWIMHINLVAPQGPGPYFWHNLFFNLRNEEVLQRRDIAKQISSSYSESEKQEKSLSNKSAESSGTIFLQTYSDPEGLGALNFIISQKPGEYLVGNPDQPTPSALLYSLAKFWDFYFSEAREIPFSELTNQNGLNKMFMIGKGMLGNLLDEVQEGGFVSIKRDASPFTIARHWESISMVIEKLYEKL